MERYGQRINELEKTIDRLTLDVNSAEAKCKAAENRLMAEESAWKTERTALEEKLKKASYSTGFVILFAFILLFPCSHWSLTYQQARLQQQQPVTSTHRAAIRRPCVLCRCSPCLESLTYGTKTHEVVNNNIRASIIIIIIIFAFVSRRNVVTSEAQFREDTGGPSVPV